MKIFVTGGAGFIGGNFVLKQILQENNIVLNFDKLTYAGNPSTLRTVSKNPNYQFVKGDICNAKALASALTIFQPDVVVNFAAESHVDRSIDEPFEFIQTNIVGTAVLLDECLKFYQTLSNEKKKQFKFLHISTDEVFGSLGDKEYFTELTPYAPNSPYSASKASSDHLVRAWHHTYGLPILITNCSNNYGPYQFPEKLIPLIILNCLSEKKLPIYGDGQNIRDWLYVEDHCDAISVVLKKGKMGETYNVGGDSEIKNLDVVKVICEIMNSLSPRKENRKYEDLITFVKDRPGHDFRYAINATKLRSNLNWEPRVTFIEGIKKTIKWYLDNQPWCDEINDGTYNQERLGVIN